MHNKNSSMSEQNLYEIIDILLVKTKEEDLEQIQEIINDTKITLLENKVKTFTKSNNRKNNTN